MVGDSAIGRWPSPRRILAGVMLLAAPMSAVLALFPATARAQMPPTPQQICQLAVQASQQGGPGVASVYGQQLLQLIYQQTGGTGVYMPLVQLGQIVNIFIGGVNHLPNGTFISCRVMHVNGYSDWQIGFSAYSQRIENSTFMPYWTAGQTLPPQQPPSPKQPTGPAASVPPIQQQTGKPPTPQPVAPSQSEACKKFPNLC